MNMAPKKQKQKFQDIFFKMMNTYYKLLKKKKKLDLTFKRMGDYF